MAKAIFTTSKSSKYDDVPGDRYHFPRSYLNQVQAAVGDWILYYEPRRVEGPNSNTGRQAYFAVARVRYVEEDPALKEHYYAYVDNYLDFVRAVQFQDAGVYPESALQKEDGSTNKGQFGRSVRPIPDSEFDAIIREGLQREMEPWELSDAAGVAEEAIPYQARKIVEQLVQRPFREQAFRRKVRDAYDNTCAISGLRLINGGGRPEVQAAHIRPVASEGPDSVRNGLALTGTLHWLFDRGLIAVRDDFRVILSSHGIPNGLDRLISFEQKLKLPGPMDLRPHLNFLRWHRENIFKA